MWLKIFESYTKFKKMFTKVFVFLILWPGDHPGCADHRMMMPVMTSGPHYADTWHLVTSCDGDVTAREHNINMTGAPGHCYDLCWLIHDKTRPWLKFSSHHFSPAAIYLRWSGARHGPWNLRIWIFFCCKNWPPLSLWLGEYWTVSSQWFPPKCQP